MVQEVKIPLPDKAVSTTPASTPACGLVLRKPVVVRSANWLGDCIIAMPAVRNLKTFLGDEPLTIAAPAKIAAVWRACPFVDEVIALENPRSFFSTASQLRKKKFASAILLPNSLRTALESTLAAIPQIIGYPGDARAWLLTAVVKRATFAFSRQHQKYSYIDLMAALGAPDTDTFPELRHPEPAPQTTDSRPQLSLCPGAEYGPAKRWPDSHFIALAKEFIERYNARVVLLGAAKDRDCAAEIAAACPSAENKAGRTSLEEFMSELTRSKLVVCNDSGSMHLSSALGVPTVAIFGSTEPRRTGPLGPRTAVVREHVLCSPCFLRECPLDFSCMHSLTVEKVLPVCLQQWTA